MITIYRESTLEYSKHVEALGNTLLELLSEALGLKRDHLKNMECSKRHRLGCHYYPACPEPELAIGATKHSDPGFLTILLQNQINGLQVSYQDQWVDIEPAPGCLVINIGDLLQVFIFLKKKKCVCLLVVILTGLLICCVTTLATVGVEWEIHKQ